MKFADFLHENIQKVVDPAEKKTTATTKPEDDKKKELKEPEKGESESHEKSETPDEEKAEHEETPEEKKKRLLKKKKTSSGNEEYDARDLKESFDKDFQVKIEEYIIDACREMKISIRAIEFDDTGVAVHYSYGKEAPQNYRTDKNELAKDIKEEVTDIFAEQGYKVKSILRSTVQDGIATLTFFVTDAKKDDKKED